MKRKFTILVNTQTWDAQQVFAAAVVAQEINSDYLKFQKSVEQISTPEEYRKYVAFSKEEQKWILSPNKVLMHRLLNDGVQFSADQLEKAEQIRQHFQGLLLQQLAGELRSFLATTLRVSSRETFESTDWTDISVVASLPFTYQNDVARIAAQAERDRIAENSQPLAELGSRITGVFTVVQCGFSPKWRSWTVNAEQNGNLILFFHKEQLPVGKVLTVTGTVKRIRERNVTQLNRVKVKF